MARRAVGALMPAASDRPISTARIVGATIAIALAAGLIERLVLGERLAANPMAPLSRDYAWSNPLVLVAIGLLILLPALALRRTPPSTLPVVALAAGSLPAFLTVFLLVPRLSTYAGALLAIGAATQAARWLIARRNPLRLLSLATVPLAVIVVAMSAPSIGARSAASVPVSPGGSAPNVIVVTLDTVRAAALSVYGAPAEASPNLARFASSAVVFDRAFSVAPWTLPSHASLFTGHFPHELSAGYEQPLNARFPTLAERFRDAGYATGGFVGNLQYCGSGSGLDRGFAHYEDYPRNIGQIASNSTLIRTIADNFRLRRLIANDQHLNRVHGEMLNASFLRWVDGNGGAPFFAFLNYFDAHEPYLPPPPFEGKFPPPRSTGRHSPLHHAMWDPAAPRGVLSPQALAEEAAAYQSAVAHLDAVVGALIDELARRRLLDSTIIVITADHGEEFAEHRVLEHGYSLYRPSLQVPLMIRLPGAAHGSQRVSEPVTLRDVASTIADVARLTDPPFPGRSLAAHWSGASPRAVGSPILSELARPRGGLPAWYPIAAGDMRSIVADGFHYIRDGTGHESVYALEDVWEKDDLASRSDMTGRLVQFRSYLEAATAQ